MRFASRSTARCDGLHRCRRLTAADVKAHFVCSSPATCDYDDARYGGSAAKSKKVREKIEGLWS
jgi:hypothetical protein